MFILTINPTTQESIGSSNISQESIQNATVPMSEDLYFELLASTSGGGNNGGGGHTN